MLISLVCQQCGKTFSVFPSRVKEGRKFCSRRCYISAPQPREAVEKRRKSNIGKRHNYKGFSFDKNGYKCVYKPEHPASSLAGYVFEHRLIAEKALGRHLDTSEVLHHIDGNPRNNDVSNLFVFENQSAHLSFHRFCENNPFLKTWIPSNLIPATKFQQD